MAVWKSKETKRKETRKFAANFVLDGNVKFPSKSVRKKEREKKMKTNSQNESE